jgi:predicted dehydrogenase
MPLKNELARRTFLRNAALGTGAVLAPREIFAAQEPFREAEANVKPIRFGIVGVGMEGSGLLKTAIELPGVECVGAADLYDGRHLLARQITGNPKLPVTRRYKELLDRKDIDCMVVAVPDFWHAQVVVDACNAGKDVYCEKPMSHTISDGFEMVEAAKKNNRIVQIGAQRVSSALCRKARELYQNGAIGKVVMVELSYGRNSPNGAWVYPPPPDLSLSNLDWNTWLKDTPKIPLSPDRFARWRAWRVYGTGVAGDLMVHLLSGMMYTLDWNEPPRSASALGGIFRFNDGRDMPDMHTVLFDYHGIPVYVRLDLECETPETARFLGTKGVLEAAPDGLQYSPQRGIDTAPSYYTGSFPEPMRSNYAKQWHKKHDPVPGHEYMADGAVYSGHNWDDLAPHLWNFFQAVRTRGTVVEDAVFGNHAAIACHMANESYFRKSPVTYSEAKKINKA